MQKDPIVEAIAEFILDSPGRPWEEVEAFMRRLNANTSQFKEALHDVSDFLYYEKYFNEVRREYQELSEKIENEEKSNFELSRTKDSVPKRTDQAKPAARFQNFLLSKITYLSTLVIVALVSAMGTYFFLSTKSEHKKDKTPGQVVVAEEQNEPTLAPIVYANQSPVDAKQVFSYPASEITLKFGGRILKEIFGFFPYWMLDVHDKISLTPYTSIALFGLTVDGDGKIITHNGAGADPGWQMWQDPRLDDFIKRAKSKKIKIFLTLKSFNNADIEKLVKNEKSQRTFISNAIQLINSRALDGANIDFEYLGDAPKDVSFAFTRLVANFDSELKRQFPKSKLSVDTYLRSATVDDFFDIDLLETYVDYLVVMGYDVHTPKGDPGPVAPMEGENGISSSMKNYLEKVDPDKLILAVPYYGYDWPVDKSQSESKTLAFAEIANLSNKPSISWDETYQTPFYRYTDSEVLREVHFENPRSLGIKYDYINSKRLAGVGIWAMGYDGNNRELEAVLLEKFTK